MKAGHKKRLEVLFNKHHSWLLAVAFNVSKNKDTAEDLVGDLYVYLGNRCNINLYYADSFNLQYCLAFLKTRFINRIKIQNRYSPLEDGWDTTDTEYNEEFDTKLDRAYNEVVNELKAMEYTRQWAPSKLTQLYFFNEDMTLEGLAKEIGISKSTAFLNVKKTKKHLKETIRNPFK